MLSDYVKKIPKYIIHLPECTRRKDNVNKLIEVTGAKIYDGLKAKDGAIGCYLSHLEVLKKERDDPVIIMEDDCIINDSNMLGLLDRLEGYDIIYFGVTRLFEGSEGVSNPKKPKKLNSNGTHAMWVSLKAKKLLLDYVRERDYFKPIDALWNLIENTYELNVWRPTEKEMTKYCEQKKGELSIIDGKIQKETAPIQTQQVQTKASGVQNIPKEVAQSTLKKCENSECIYRIHPDVNNNYGTHCCLGCKRAEGHGVKCEKVIFVATNN